MHPNVAPRGTELECRHDGKKRMHSESKQDLWWRLRATPVILLAKIMHEKGKNRGDNLRVLILAETIRAPG
jgi:hypothetical protein